MRAYTAKQKALLAIPGVNVQYLIEIDCGGGTVLRISDSPVSAADSFDGYAYEARVVKDSLGKLVWEAGAADNKTSFRAYNGDDYFTDLEEAGTVLDEARVYIHQFFRDLVGDITVPAAERALQKLWTGHVKQATTDRDEYQFEVGYGQQELSRQAFNVYGGSCRKLFADGEQCPYSPLDGRGLPESYAAGTSTDITGLVLTDTGANFISAGLEVGHYLFARHASDSAQVAVGIIQTVTSTTLTVDSWRLGGTPATGWKYVAGPPATDCGYSRGECIRLGMFGPSEVHPAGLGLSKNKRRFLGALAPCSQAEWQARSANNIWKFRERKRFGWIPMDNQGLEGKVIPVHVGRVAVPNLDLLAIATEGIYIWSLFSAGVGRLGGVTDILLNSDPLLLDNADDDSPYGPQAGDRAVRFGFGTEDYGAIAAGELTEDQQKSAIGSRQSRADFLGSQIDTYVGNPWVFSDPDLIWRSDGNPGNGPSFDGMAVLALRAVPAGGVKSLDLQASVLIDGGLWTKTPAGTWTNLPDVSEFASWFVRSPNFNANLKDAELDLTTWGTYSAYCRALVTNSQVEFPTIAGSVGYGPEDVYGGMSGDSIWVELSQLPQAERYVGGKLTINAETYTVISVWRISRYSLIGFNYGTDNQQAVDDEGYIVQVDAQWTTVPRMSDGFSLAAPTTIERYLVNGSLKEEATVAQGLEMILKNGAASWIVSAGKIRPVWREPANLTEVDLRTPFADSGANPTVVVRNGETSAKWKRKGPTEAVNTIKVEFCDRQSGYVMRSFEAKNTAAQKQLKDRFGLGRDKKSGNLTLPLTASLDQALRLTALEMRLHGQRADGSHSGPFELEAPLHFAAEVEPWDVWPVALDGFPAWLEYGRALKVALDPTTGIMDLEFEPYVHADHNDSANDVSSNYQPNAAGGQTAASRVKINALTEGTIVDNHEKLVESIQAELTLPDGPKRPVSAYLAWKYRTEPLGRTQLGPEVKFDYDKDSNPGLKGVQNEATIWDIPFLPDSEIIDVFIVPPDGSPLWRKTGITTTLTTSGGIDADEQVFTVASSAGFAAGTACLFDDTSGETFVILSVNGTSWTVRRGEHGTAAAAHAQGCTIRRRECSLPMKSITLTGVLAGLPAPSDLVADGIADAIQTAWTSNLSEAQFKQLDYFKLYHSKSVIPPDGAGADTIRLTKETNYSFVPPVVSGKMDGAAYYFRVSAVDISGVESALSNQSAPESAIVTIPKIAGPSAPVCLLVEGGGKSLLTRANRASAADWLANIASCRLEIYKGSTPSSDETPADPRQGYIDDTDQPFTYQLGGQGYGNYWARARVTDSLAQVSSWGLSTVKLFDPTTSTSDTAVMDRTKILIDVDTYEVDNVYRANTVKFAVAEDPSANPSQDDSADIVEVQLVHGSSMPSFTAAGGFDNPDFVQQAPFAAVTVYDARLLSIWRYWLTAKVHNAFGWSQWRDPVEYTVTLDPTVSADDDVPSLAKFAVWTAQEPPNPADPLITGLMMRFDGELAAANSNVVFDIVIQGYSSQTFPEDTVALDEGDGTATATMGVSSIPITGLASPVTLNQFANEVLRLGRIGAKNAGQLLGEHTIVSNTASPEGSPPYSTTLTLLTDTNVRNSGMQTYWSIITETVREKLQGKEWHIDMDVTGTGSKPQRHFFSERKEINVGTPLYFRAAGHGEYGIGAWRYATANDTGTPTPGLATLKSTQGMRTDDIKDAAVTTPKVADGAIVADKLTENSQDISFPATAFSSTSYRRVGWTAFTLKYAGTSSYSIVAGDTGDMAPSSVHYIWWDKDVSTTVLQTGTSYSSGEHKRLLCVAWPAGSASGGAAYTPVAGMLGVNDRNLMAESVTTESLAAGSVTAAKIYVAYLSAISADLGSVNAGTVTGALIRTDTGAAGHYARIQLDSTSGLQAIDSSNITRVQLPLTGDSIVIRANDTTPGKIKFGDFGELYASSDTLFLKNLYGSAQAMLNLQSGWSSIKSLAGSYAAEVGCLATVSAAEVYMGNGVQFWVHGHQTVDGMKLGFFNATPILRPTITGERNANPAVADLLTKVALLGLITDSTTLGNSPFDASNISSGTLSTDRFSGYADLVAESKIGTGSTQVAAGDHTHPGAMGDVYGPASATAHQIAVFADTTGKVIEGGYYTVAVSNADGTMTTSHLDPYTGNAYDIGNTSRAYRNLYIGRVFADYFEPRLANSIAIHGAFLPEHDNTYPLGSVAQRWSDVRSVLFNGSALGTAAYTASGDYAVAAKGVTNGDSHDHAGGDGAQIAYSTLSGLPSLTGYVTGPASATDHAIARFDGTTGKLIENSTVTIADNGVLTATSQVGTTQMQAGNGSVGWVSMVTGTSGVAGYVRWYIDATTRIAYLGSSAGGAGNLGLNLENSAKFNINGGYVGIGKGTNNPTTALDVNGTVTATLFSGSGASLTTLNGTNISSGTVATARLNVGAGAGQVAAGDHTHSPAEGPAFHDVSPTGSGYYLGTDNYQWTYSSIGSLSVDWIGALNANSVALICALLPNSDNNYPLGTSPNRWSDMRSVLINGSDIGFSNGWKLREYPATKEDLGKPDEWFRKHANEGLQLLNNKDELIALFHRSGVLYVKDVKPLSELVP